MQRCAPRCAGVQHTTYSVARGRRALRAHRQSTQTTSCDGRVKCVLSRGSISPERAAQRRAYGASGMPDRPVGKVHRQRGESRMHACDSAPCWAGGGWHREKARATFIKGQFNSSDFVDGPGAAAATVRLQPSQSFPARARHTLVHCRRSHRMGCRWSAQPKREHVHETLRPFHSAERDRQSPTVAVLPRTACLWQPVPPLQTDEEEDEGRVAMVAPSSLESLLLRRYDSS